MEPISELTGEVVVSAESSFDSGEGARPGVEVSSRLSEGDVEFLAGGAQIGDRRRGLRVSELTVELPGDVSFQAAHDFLFGLALSGSSSRIFSRPGVGLALPPFSGHLTRENVHMGKTRREFTPEYKDEAVKLVINTGRAIATVARELGINEASLGRWVIAFKARNDTGETAVTESERAELLRLRKENADLKLDRAFLNYSDVRIMPMFA